MTGRNLVMVKLTVLMMAGFLGVSVLSYFMARQSLTDQIRAETLPLTSVSIFSTIKQDLVQPILIANIMANDTFVHEWSEGGEVDPMRMVRYLKRIQEQNGASSAFYVSDKTRRYFHSTGVLREVSRDDLQDAWFFRARDMEGDYEVNVDIDTKDLKSLTVFINFKVRDTKGNLLGITGVGIAVSSLREMIDMYRNLHDLSVFFVDKSGAIKLSGPEFSAVSSLSEVDGLSGVADRILNSEQTLLSYERDGEVTHLGARLIPEFDWYLIVERQENPWDRRLVMPVLVNMLIGLVMTLLVFSMVYGVLRRYQKRLEDMAVTDKLTGVSNRHAFDVVMEQFVKMARRKDNPFSALVLDIDNFKAINDSYGHPAGDAVLQGLVWVVRRILRESDMVFRWGGEEFLILLSDCHETQSKMIAEKLREAIENHVTSYEGHNLEVTVSIGVAQWHKGENAEDVVIRADKALLRAKDQGRNRIVSAGDEAL